jgi:hypothetical protein
MYNAFNTVVYNARRCGSRSKIGAPREAYAVIVTLACRTRRTW